MDKNTLNESKVETVWGFITEEEADRQIIHINEIKLWENS